MTNSTLLGTHWVMSGSVLSQNTGSKQNACGVVGAADHRVLPPAHLTPLQPQGPAKRKKKKRKKIAAAAAASDGVHDLPPAVNAPTRTYVAPTLPPRHSGENPRPGAGKAAGPWTPAWLQPGEQNAGGDGPQQAATRPQNTQQDRRKTPPSPTHQQQYVSNTPTASTCPTHQQVVRVQHTNNNYNTCRGC